MLGVLAAEIHLMPDWTVLVQLGIFLSVLAVLAFFVFRPVLRIIDRRRLFTAEARAEAGSLAAEAAELEAQHARAIAAALSEGEAMRAQKVAANQAEAERIVAAAREQARRLVDSTEVSVESSEEAAAGEIRRQAEAMAGEIVARIQS